MRAVERWPFGVREKIKAVVYNALSRPIPRPRLDDCVREALESYLEEDISQLRAHAGRRFEAWCVR
jgi:hypothetical protein